MSSSRRILICNHGPFSLRLGATKLLVEVGDGLAALGWRVEHFGLAEAEAEGFDVCTGGAVDHARFGRALRGHLRRRADDFDVVDYDQLHLPYPRADLPGGTLMVARSSLLHLHLLSIRIPPGPTLWQRVGHVVRGPQRRRRHRQWAATARRTFAGADLVNVSCAHDRRALIADGVAAGKIVVLPYGIGRDRRAAFDAVSADPPVAPRVGFVGTFDYRKGGREMPALFARIADAVPDVRFSLLGTAAMFKGTDQILAHFPPRLRGHLRVVPNFDPANLPSLLADCSVGVFPSRLEGFGIGVLEMLAAAVPVVAYDAPGPPEMLPPDRLVAPADWRAMADRVVGLLRLAPADLATARRDARASSRRFDWADVAAETAAVYDDALRSRRAASADSGAGAAPAR